MAEGIQILYQYPSGIHLLLVVLRQMTASVTERSGLTICARFALTGIASIFSRQSQEAVHYSVKSLLLRSKSIISCAVPVPPSLGKIRGTLLRWASAFVSVI